MLWLTLGATFVAGLCVVILGPVPWELAVFLALPFLAELLVRAILLVAMTEGRNWARIIFLGYSAYWCILTASSAVLDARTIPAIVALDVVVSIATIYALVLLFRRESNSWFGDIGAKRTVRIAIAAIVLASVTIVGGAFLLLSSIMPEQLLAAQIHRPLGNRNPTDLPLPQWFIDLHWKLAGERIVDEQNRSSPGIAKFMLGTELSRHEQDYSLDDVRFSELMKHYLCEAPNGIPVPAEIARYRNLSTVPEYVGALKSCGRIPN